MYYLFGIDLDPDEREESVRKKTNYIKSLSLRKDTGFSDPYDAVASQLQEGSSMHQYAEAPNKIQVEQWLTSKPKVPDLVTVANYVFFVDSNGCNEYAERVRDFVRSRIFPRVPIMIGVDHSSSGGAIEALSKECDPGNLSLIILDSHFDAILPEVRCGLVQYDLETNPKTKFRRLDPYIWGRPNSYNADSFIHYLTSSHAIHPENLIAIGVSDHPPAKALEIADERVRSFVDAYLGFEQRGSKIITKEDINLKGISKALIPVLMNVKTPYTYVSLDIDVGAISAHHGSRYLNVQGLNENQIYIVVRLLKQILSRRGAKIVGFDLMETDVHSAGQALADGSTDRTYYIEKKITRLLFPDLGLSDRSVS